MNKKLIDALNSVYSKIESALTDESIKTVARVIEKQNDELGSIIQGMEDGDYDEPVEEESSQNEG